VKVLGKPRRRVDGRAKVTGQTRFADDIVLPRMLHMKLLRSPYPHALIEGIDSSKAQAHPGVHLLLTGKDFPVTFGILPVSQDEYPLAPEHVRYVGDPVAAVIAKDEQTAAQALDLVEVKYRPLKTISDPVEALQNPEPRIHAYSELGNIHRLQAFEFGDVNESLQRSDLVFEDLFFYEGNTHLPIEQHAAVAAVDGEGKLTLWSSTQVPHYVHRSLARVLQLSPTRIRVVATPNGGGFGGKCDVCNHEMVVAKAAVLLGRPVKICLNREEVFYMHRGRHPVLMKFRTGVTKDGKLTGMHLQTLVDGGGYGSYGTASTFYTGALQTVTYELPRYKFEAARVFTNKPPCGPKRGHGTPQPRFGDHRQLAQDRLDRPRRMHQASRRTLGLEEQVPQTSERQRRGACLRLVPLRRGAADLLQQDAAVRRAAARGPQRPGNRVLRRDRDRAGLGRRAGGDHRGGARHRPLRRALRHRRHRHDAGRPRLVLEPCHGHDG
jgi:CO/xanthine dehydrogenase Mo-binding subunit